MTGAAPDQHVRVHQVWEHDRISGRDRKTANMGVVSHCIDKYNLPIFLYIQKKDGIEILMLQWT